MKIGDIIVALPEADMRYSITNTSMGRAYVVGVDGDQITIKATGSGKFDVDSKFFKKIGEVKPFDRTEVIRLLSKGKTTEIFDYDLRGANLSEANLSGADLSRADLSGADLSGANLSEADLSRADLSGANLYEADLRGADLSEANLSGADLRGADLSGADLSRADLSGADLSRADLSGADLSGVLGLLESCAYIDAHFEKTDKGYIAYKTFGSFNTPPAYWTIEPDSIICENVNFNRTEECGCGVNVGTLEWVKENTTGQIWKVLIEWPWLAGVVVPYSTDGKIRCERVRLLEKIER